MKTKSKSVGFGILLIAASVAAHAAQFGDFEYWSSDTEIAITGYTGPGGDVIIPDRIAGLPVTSIVAEAFLRSANLTDVTIPNSVTSIGASAFSECTSLTNVVIGNDIANIESAAFAHCTSLASVTIPPSVTAITGWAFSGCASLTNATIPNSVTSIGVGAFAHCASLNSVTIPNSLALIQGAAFYGCTSLTSIGIPDSVTTIEVKWVKGEGTYGAFQDCTGLVNVTIGSGITNISVGTFQGCTSLTAIDLNARNPVLSSLDGVVFNKNQDTLVLYPTGKSGGYAVPGGVTSIGDGAFRDCTGLTSVTIGNGLINIRDIAFLGCSRLRGVYFRGNAPSFDPNAFLNANNATVYYLPATTGWRPTLGGRPTAVWRLPYPVILDFGSGFGVQPDGFGFIIPWATYCPVVVEASADLIDPVWSAVSTNTLINGSSSFRDPQWRSRSGGFYRVRSP